MLVLWNDQSIDGGVEMIDVVLMDAMMVLDAAVPARNGRIS